MKLELKRDTFTDKTTIGKLYVDGIEYAHTLEDRDRKLEDGGIKVYGETCVPRGTYEINIDWSNKYNKFMPHILNVPQFEGIRIHPGNYAKDTEGCILVGKTRGIDFIGDSRAVFENLFEEMENAVMDGEKIEITIT